MKYEINANHGFLIIAAAVCLAIVLVISQPGVCDSRVPQDSSEGDDELQLREDTSVREVNEATSAEIAQAEAVKRNRYQEELGYVPSGSLISDEELASFEKARAEKEKAIRARFGSEIKPPEQQQAGPPVSRTEDVKRRPLVWSSVPAAKPMRGAVTGIVFCEKQGAALVDGEVVRENDTLLGVRVVRILPDYVEFEKQGSKWRQMVGQTPPETWQEKSSSDQQSSPARQTSSKSKVKTGR